MMWSIKISRLSLAIMMAVLLSQVSSAYGQKLTEQFIPIGKSPGLSQKYTTIGEVEQFDSGSQTLTLTTTSGKHSLKLTDKTRIWLDRSKIKLTNIKGSTADLQKGRKVEVKYEDYPNKTSAEWIKIEIT